MDSFEVMKKRCIGEEHLVQPHEIGNFINGKCTMTYQEKPDVKWFIDVQLLDKTTMKVTDIRRESVIHTI